MPANNTNLLSLIAARMVLSETNRSTPSMAMATLISPDLAITPDHVFGRRKRIGQNVKLRFDGREDLPIETEATLVSHDSKADFAVLKLKSGLQINLPPSPLADEHPPKGALWQSLIITPTTRNKGDYVSGTVDETQMIDGIQHLRLLTSRESQSGSSGAPIMVDDRIVGIMARGAKNHESYEWFAIPISVMLKSKEGGLIREVVIANHPISGAVTEPDLFGRLSSHALEALRLADGIRRQMNRESVHMEHLFAALFEKANGPAQKLIDEAHVERNKVFEILSEHAKQSFRNLNSYTPTRLTSLPSRSPHVIRALEEALVIANEYSSREILSRHLLYGALSVTDCDLVIRLKELGLSREKIVMIDTVVSAEELIAGYRSDEAKGKDLLGIKNEVEALCSVLAAKEVSPPLSLGLFGDWGSGKSFFMGEMEKRIKAILEEEKNKKDSPYCRNIAQLWFNAWHYIDTELWASLAKEIFDGLAQSLTPQNDKEEMDYKQAKLIARQAELETEKQKQREIEQKLEELEKGKSEIETNPRRVIVEAYRFAERQPEVQDAAREVERNFNNKIDEAAKKLAITPNEVKEQLLEAHGLWRKARAVWAATKRVRPNKLWMILAIAVIVIVPSGVWAILQSLNLNITGVLAGLATLLMMLSPFIKSAMSALTIINDAIETNSKLLENERRKLQNQLVEQQKLTTEKSAEVARVSNEVESLRTDRKIADFIKQRNASADYSKYLGVIARAHADFEQLSKLLMREQEGNLDDPTTVLPRIDRIILYIDDLDRCPEDKVVQVLQAVHLLLAFPIFVVVVGVDSRWLLHSLRQHSSAFRENKEELSPLTEEEDKHWRSTPLNYLEKIFQIPFTLRPMESKGFEDLIDALAAPQLTPAPEIIVTKPENEVPPEAPTAEIEKPNTVVDQPENQDASQINPPDSPADPQPSVPKTLEVAQTVEIKPEHLRIESWERQVMKKLFPLIPSPRAAKRFVNIYRLLRVLTPKENRAAFIGDEEYGQHRAVLTLLAILIGYPKEATETLRGLLELKEELRRERLQNHRERREVEWWEFLQKFDPDASDHNGTGPDADSPQAESVERWRELITKLKGTGVIHQHQSCDDFIEWAEEVARYSFQSGRVLLERQSSSEVSASE